MYNRDQLLVQTAMMYYEQGLTQNKISEKLGISRPTISTFLKEAREQNIVTISINHLEKEAIKKQQLLQSKYKNRNIFIASNNGNVKNSKEAVGRLCANYIAENIEKYNSIGVGWGSTVSEVISAFPTIPYQNIRITPLIGGMGYKDVKLHSNHLAFMLSEKLSCSVEFLYAPAVLNNDQYLDSFLSNPFINNVISNGKKCDLAIVGVGSSNLENYEKFEIFTSSELELLKENEIIGDILASFFNSRYEDINFNLPKRIIGLTLNDLKNINNVIAVATGSDKSIPIDLLLSKDIINTLFIDEVLADELIRLNNPYYFSTL